MAYEQTTSGEAQSREASNGKQREASASECAFVKEWAAKIVDARQHWEDDFKRMRKNMRFAGGLQWNQQVTTEDERYVINLVQRQVNNKVAQLYARNPRVQAKRRKRLDYSVWDGRMETLQHAVALTAAVQDPNDPSFVAAQALIADYVQGRQKHDFVDRLSATLENVFQWQLDNQIPDFKTQMKQLVRRTVTCGVGYVGVDFERTDGSVLEQPLMPITLQERIKVAKEILVRLEEGVVMEDAAIVEKLRSLFTTIESSRSSPQTDKELREQLVFTFPMATSVIIDPRCTALKGFINAHWIALESYRTKEEIEAFFGITLDTTSVDNYDSSVDSTYNSKEVSKDSEPKTKRLCLWKVFDLDTRSMFYICHGWKQYVEAPQPVFPEISNFWPIFPLVFNDVETESEDGSDEGKPLSIFPPSDVQLLVSPQKEWNRSREGWRRQRRANEPKYVTGSGFLSDLDKDNIQNAETNAIIEIVNVPPGTDVSKLIAPLPKAPIDPMVYDTAPLAQDMFMVLGNEEGPVPAASHATATAATINEQSRVTTASSNVDDLNDFLSLMAKSGGEILMREMSESTVKSITGDGAVWVGTDQEVFVNRVFLDVKVGSNGRPNKALETANLQMLAPTILAAGGNSPRAIEYLLRKSLERLDDDDIEIDEIVPMGSTMPQGNMNFPAGQQAAPTMSGQTPPGVGSEPKVSPKGALEIQPKVYG